jgi:type IV pilus assembly protein PilB
MLLEMDLSNILADRRGTVTVKKIDRFDRHHGEITDRNGHNNCIPNRTAVNMNNSIEQLVDRILDRAISEGATDLYFEPQADALQLQVRQDGKLSIGWQYTGNDLNLSILHHFQQLAGIDRQVPAPQIGKFDRICQNEKTEIIIAIVPSQFGEIIHLQVLYSDRQPPSLETAITDRDLLAIYRSLLHSNRGLILIAGGKDSGKSTTIASSLAELVRPDRLIYTIDRQIKFKLSGVNQIAVGNRDLTERIKIINAGIDLNPDIMAIGLIDCLEIAELAIKAVDRGCLVFATVMAENVGQAISAFLGFGIDPLRLSRAMLGTIAQTLVTQLCPQCREAYTPSDIELAALGRNLITRGKRDCYYRPRLSGKDIVQNVCPKCHNRGDNGRSGLYEILPWNRPIESIVISGDANRINIAAQEIGMRCLSELALDLFRHGHISLAEVKRCLSPQSLLQDPISSDLSGGRLDSQTDSISNGYSSHWQQQATQAQLECQQLISELEQYQQEAANFEYRIKQTRVQVEQTTRAEAALQLLTAIDTIELAKNSIKPQTDRETAIQKGYMMLDKKMLSSLREIGVCTIETVGHKFDSRLHEILKEEGTQDYPSGTILAEFKRGYLLGDRVLRLAQVKVAIASSFM